MSKLWEVNGRNWGEEMEESLRQNMTIVAVCQEEKERPRWNLSDFTTERSSL